MSKLRCKSERMSSCRDGPRLETCNSIPTVLFASPTKTDMSCDSIARFAGNAFDETVVLATAGRLDASCVNARNG